MPHNNELTPEQLRTVCSEDIFNFKTTSELPTTTDIIGQDRAVEAIEFGMDIDSDGFNIYALGPAGAGRTATIEQFVQKKSKKKPVPSDWCYVYNFEDPRKPKSLSLPPGKGREFRNDMDKFRSGVKDEIRQALERDDYQNEKNAITEKYKKEQNARFSQLREKAEKNGFTIQRGPTGVFIVPVNQKREPLSRKDYEQLPQDQKKQLEQKGEELQQELNNTLHSARDLERKAKEEIEQLERKTVLFAIEHHIEDLKEKYKDHSKVQEYLDGIKEDVAQNASNIVSSDEQSGGQAQALSALMSRQQENILDHYQVNLIVDNSQTQGAPVIVEGDPTYHNIMGKFERQAQMGMLITSFNMIKPGALHRANGGFLILEADHLLRNPFSYDALKHALEDKEIKITDIAERYSLISTA
ncbi:MAG: AAA family ATPase, partial [Spirochaetota bacterium]